MNFLLLAAGRSQRMGSNKALMMFQGEPWIHHLVRQIEKNNFHHIIVVTSPEAAEAVEEITAHYKNIRICVNQDPERGPFSSLQIGIKENDGQVLFVSPIDTPLKSTTLQILKSNWQQNNESTDAIIPSYQEQRGHPVILSPAFQRHLLTLTIENPSSRLDFAIRELPEMNKRIISVDDPFILINLNTPEDLASLKKITNPT